MNESLINKDMVILDLPVNSKTEALHHICAHLYLHKKTVNPSSLYDDIIEREDKVSTFAGQQVAIPHVITQYISEPTLCFVRIENEDFTWSDNDQNVRMIFLLCVPEQHDLQKLRLSQSYIFSSIAQLMGDMKIIDLWLTTNDQQAILDSLQLAFESNLNKTTG